MKQRSKITLLLCIFTCLTACASTLNKLEGIGKPPPLSALKDPSMEPDYKNITWPLPESPVPVQARANSLWQPGARAVGDTARRYNLCGIRAGV